jgi:hypothetical protein
MKYCNECKDGTRWITVEQASEAAHRCRRTIYYWIDKRHVHARELASGWGQLICERSLLRKREESDEGDSDG